MKIGKIRNSESENFPGYETQKVSELIKKPAKSWQNSNFFLGGAGG